MGEPKKVNFADLKSKTNSTQTISQITNTTPQLTELEKKALEDKKKKEEDLRADKLLDKYAEREQEYVEVGSQRAQDDKAKKETWKKKREGYFRTSIFITYDDNDYYEELRREARGTLRFGYRHIFRYAISQLKKMSLEEGVKRLVEIDEEFNKQGLVIKE